MITIHNLEVRFEVEGDEKQQFARLFEEFIRRWAAETELKKAHEARAGRDRSLAGTLREGGV